MFQSFKDDISKNRGIDECVDRKINPMDEWRIDCT